jgi:hypothetical protein
MSSIPSVRYQKKNNYPATGLKGLTQENVPMLDAGMAMPAAVHLCCIWAFCVSFSALLTQLVLHDVGNKQLAR